MGKWLNNFILLSTALSIAFLVGCQSKDTPSSLFDNYLYRLTNSLNVESVSVPSEKVLPRYPSRQQLRYSLEPININLLAFLRLSPCELQRHIGERNSSLGQLMTDDQQLIYTYRFLVLANECLQQLEKTSELSQLLQQAIEQKIEQLPRLRWNATLASDEFNTLFSLGSIPLAQSQLDVGMGELIESLNVIQRAVSSNTVGNQQLQNAYAVVGSSKRLGELRLSMSLASNRLAVADQLLQQRLQQRPLCFRQKSNSQFMIVDTVFRQFYIGEIQPYLALLHQQSQQAFSQLQRLIESLPEKDVFTLFWQQVYKGEASEWQQFNRALKTHTEYWQQLLTQCGAMPK